VVPQLEQWRRVTASSFEQTGQVEMTSCGMRSSALRVGARRDRRAHRRLGSALDGGLPGRRSVTAVTARRGLEQLASAQPFGDPSLTLFLLELTCCEFEHFGLPRASVACR
jgi:hypothetical protein